jgi:selenocysteine lyase/cysteine desulfurase
MTSRIPRLARYARKLIGKLPGVELITPVGAEAGFVHFHVKGWEPQDLCGLLNKKKFMVRPVPKPHLPTPARISTGFYNTEEELELFAEALKELIT